MSLDRIEELKNTYAMYATRIQLLLNRLTIEQRCDYIMDPSSGGVAIYSVYVQQQLCLVEYEYLRDWGIELEVNTGNFDIDKIIEIRDTYRLKTRKWEDILKTIDV